MEYSERHPSPRLPEAYFPVAFLGSFSAGKSTIINALLGLDLLPENTGATTAVPTIIRRGDQDLARIHYLDEASKNETRDLLTQDIVGPLGIWFEWGEDERDSLRKLSYEVEANRALGRLDTKAFRYLSYFVDNYADHIDKVKTARVENIRSFIENYKDVIFIDRIEIFLKDIDIPKNLVLIDLPSLGVLNRRHDRVTKDYVERKAKAFVVCLKPMNLLEGQELQFLRGVYERDRSVLNRAFWVLNQWDRLTPVQRADQDAEFAYRIARDFQLRKGRDFRVSALNHLMRTILAKGDAPSPRMKSHFERSRYLALNVGQDVEQLKQMLADDADAEQFDAFKTALFHYLNTTAKHGYLQSVGGEYKQTQPFPPPFADAWGDDEFGLWAEFELPTTVSIRTDESRVEAPLSEPGAPVVQRLRWIEPGSFWMGSREDEHERLNHEGPRHLVTLTRGFWLADTACTQALWQSVMDGDDPSQFKGASRPVEKVSWEDVQRFLRALEALLPGCTAGLPTEAEWEYACRAGTGTPFSFSKQITPDHANYDGYYPYAGGEKGANRQETVPVKNLPPNAWGLYEMHGNVWEWCADGKRAYTAEPQIDPLGERGEGKAARCAIRGGSWDGDARRVRSAYRRAARLGFADDDLGFRLSLRSIEPGRPSRWPGGPA